MMIGIVGKPNVGKSTFFRALTLADVRIADYPFTTIEPNQAVAHVTAACPCAELGVKCSPQNSRCVDGTRMIPVRLIDVAGLVPGAHEGRGLGNKFLDDLRNASALIHVVDCSGATDAEGRRTSGYDVAQDVRMLEMEIDAWIAGIIKKADSREDFAASAAKQLTGLGISPEMVRDAIRSAGAEPLKLAGALRKASKPMIVAANKMDMPGSKGNLGKVAAASGGPVVPCSAEMEVALRLASKSGMISYVPGSGAFEMRGSASVAQKGALDAISAYLGEWGSTGVQQCLNRAVFELLGCIVVYPVEDENRFSNKKGQILPDAHLVPRGTTAKSLAGIIHTDLERNFVAAVDARTGMRVAANHELKDGDIIKIVSAR